MADEYLMPNEHIVYQTNPHWVIFAMPIGFFVVALATYFLFPFLAIFGYALAAFAVGAMVLSTVTYRFTEYVITNKRYIKKYGFITRSSSGVLLNRIESVDVRQTLTGRLFGFGIVLVTGTGGGRDFAYNIPSPFEFRTKLQNAIHGNA